MNQTPDEFRQAFLLPFIAAVLALHRFADLITGDTPNKGAAETAGVGDLLYVLGATGRTCGNTGFAFSSLCCIFLYSCFNLF